MHPQLEVQISHPYEGVDPDQKLAQISGTTPDGIKLSELVDARANVSFDDILQAATPQQMAAAQAAIKDGSYQDLSPAASNDAYNNCLPPDCKSSSTIKGPGGR